MEPECSLPHSQMPATWIHDKPEIHSGSTPSLQPRFGTFVLLVVPKLEGDIKGSTFFIGCRSWGGCAQIDQQQTRNFLHQRYGEMDRTSEGMYGHKWWICWKISVQCGRELNFLHSDITVIILHGQILILYNWRPYLSITPLIIVLSIQFHGIDKVSLLRLHRLWNFSSTVRDCEESISAACTNSR